MPVHAPVHVQQSKQVSPAVTSVLGENAMSLTAPLPSLLTWAGACQTASLLLHVQQMLEKFEVSNSIHGPSWLPACRDASVQPLQHQVLNSNHAALSLSECVFNHQLIRIDNPKSSVCSIIAVQYI